MWLVVTPIPRRACQAAGPCTTETIRGERGERGTTSQFKSTMASRTLGGGATQSAEAAENADDKTLQPRSRAHARFTQQGSGRSAGHHTFRGERRGGGGQINSQLGSSSPRSPDGRARRPGLARQKLSAENAENAEVRTTAQFKSTIASRTLAAHNHNPQRAWRTRRAEPPCNSNRRSPLSRSGGRARDNYYPRRTSHPPQPIWLSVSPSISVAMVMTSDIFVCAGGRVRTRGRRRTSRTSAVSPSCSSDGGRARRAMSAKIAMMRLKRDEASASPAYSADDDGHVTHPCADRRRKK
jgi:hypothetical protein